MKNVSKKIIAGMVAAATLAVTFVAMAAGTSASTGTADNSTNPTNSAAGRNIPGPGRGLHKGWNMENKGMVIGKITAISGTTITLTTEAPPAPPALENAQSDQAKNNSKAAPTLPAFAAKTFTVNAASATILLNGETSSLSGLSVGDRIVVKGTASSSDSTQITAKIIDKITDAIKNRVHYRILGQITALNGNTLTVKDSNGTSYTVNVTADKTNVIINGEKADVSKLAVGDQIMVGGFAKDSTTTTITAGQILKGTEKRQGLGPKMGQGQGKGQGRGMGTGPGTGLKLGLGQNQ